MTLSSRTSEKSSSSVPSQNTGTQGRLSRVSMPRASAIAAAALYSDMSGPPATPGCCPVTTAREEPSASPASVRMTAASTPRARLASTSADTSASSTRALRARAGVIALASNGGSHGSSAFPAVETKSRYNAVPFISCAAMRACKVMPIPLSGDR